MKVLFIGAGASFGARDDFSDKPPLGTHLCQWLREKKTLLLNSSGLIELRSTVKEAFEVLDRHPTENDFENLLKHLNRDERISLHKILQIVFSDLSVRKVGVTNAFISRSDLYDNLIRELNILDGTWSIVSLNYDLLFEEALYRANIEFYYPFFGFTSNQAHEKKTGVKFYKPHGSINFFAQADIRTFSHKPTESDSRGVATQYDFDQNTALPNYPIIFAGLAGTENVIGRASNSSIPQVVMANFQAGKKAETNPQIIEKIRTNALECVANASSVLVIGVRPTDSVDDPFVASCIEKIQKGTWVTPSAQHLEFINSINPKIELIQKTLREYLINSKLLN